MCGIIAAISSRDIVPVILDGLARLEYRGYDSAGLAVLDKGQIVCRRAVGKLTQLKGMVDSSPLAGTIGLGHTRWATHGSPTVANTHPQSTDLVTVVHNGIIENHEILRAELEVEGYTFHSETDTEVVPVLLTHLCRNGMSALDAIKAARHRLQGMFSLAIMFADDDSRIYAVRAGAPMIYGHGDGIAFFCSDVSAAVSQVRHFTGLENGDVAVLTMETCEVFDADDQIVQRIGFTSERLGLDVDKAGFRHFMLKEIHEQPDAIRRTLQAYQDIDGKRIRLPWVPFDPKRLNRIVIVASGSSRIAGQVGKYWIESFARIPVDVEIASEFSYRNPMVGEGTLMLAISQSGETADTLRAGKIARQHGEVLAGIINVPESALVREADIVLPVLAGPEIGVVATKTFGATLAVLAVFAIYLARSRNQIGRSGEELLCRQLAQLPLLIEEALTADEQISALAKHLSTASHVMFLGRGSLYPVAELGALIMTSLAYVSTTAHAGGEMKHGPLALVDADVNVVVLATSDSQIDKLWSNIEEVRARAGKVTVLADATAAPRFEREESLSVITIPAVPQELTAPGVFAAMLQLLAYHVAVFKGTDVDQPRNLAKSVTVE